MLISLVFAASMPLPRHLGDESDVVHRSRAGTPLTRLGRQAPDVGAGAARGTLCVLVPTRAEAGNIDHLVRRVSAAVAGISTEVLLVDDSDDETPEAIRSVALAGRAGRCGVALIHREARQRQGGLGGAVVEGLRAARSRWVCVMDADLQHPPEVIPRLLAAAEDRGADLVVASRYRDHGHAGGLSAMRTGISRASTLAAKALFPRRLRAVTDPMSGFFLVRRDAVDIDRLRPRGFKILLELLVREGELRTTEVGFAFGARHAGISKGSLREGLRYLGHLCRLRLDATGRPTVGPESGGVAVELLVGATPAPQEG